MEANYFTKLYWFCHRLTWIYHGCTCVPHPEPHSHLPPHFIPLCHASAPAPSTLYHASNLDWPFEKHIFHVSWHYFASCCTGDIAEIKNTKSCFWELLITQEIKQKFLYPSQKAKSRTLTQKDSNSGMLILFSPADSMTEGYSLYPSWSTPLTSIEHSWPQINSLQKQIPIQREKKQHLEAKHTKDNICVLCHIMNIKNARLYKT